MPWAPFLCLPPRPPVGKISSTPPATALRRRSKAASRTQGRTPTNSPKSAPSAATKSTFLPDFISTTVSSMLPRGTNYQRLEIGDKDDESVGRGGRRMRRFGWKKFALGAGMLIAVVWLFGPRERRDQVWNGIKSNTPCAYSFSVLVFGM